MKGRKFETFWDKISLTGYKWSNSNAPGSETPVSHPLLGDSLFPIFSPCSFLSSSLGGNKKWEPPVWGVKRWKKSGGKIWGTICSTCYKWSNLNAPGSDYLGVDLLLVNCSRSFSNCIWRRVAPPNVTFFVGVENKMRRVDQSIKPESQ